MAILKEVFDIWVQEVFKLFNFIAESEGVIEEELLLKTEVDLEVHLKITAYGKEMEIMVYKLNWMMT